jgi:hypothetical protein
VTSSQCCDLVHVSTWQLISSGAAKCTGKSSELKPVIVPVDRSCKRLAFEHGEEQSSVGKSLDTLASPGSEDRFSSAAFKLSVSMELHRRLKQEVSFSHILLDLVFVQALMDSCELCQAPLRDAATRRGLADSWPAIWI